MKKRALILVHKGRRDRHERPACLLSSGGLSLLERQLRQLARLGIKDAYVCALDHGTEIERALGDMRRIPSTTKLLRSVSELKAFETDGGPVLLLDDALLIDDRLIKAVWANDAPLALMFEGTSERKFAGVAKIPASLVAAKACNATGQSFLPSLIASAQGENGVVQLNTADIPLYIPDRRRDVPLLLREVLDPAEAAHGTDALIAMAQKGTLDWPAKYIHPFFENRLTKLLLGTPVTPNQVTLATAVLGFGATYLFATGQMLAALAIALILGVLDGVDGKLARTKMLTSRVGELEHIVDKLVEYSWYFAIAYALYERGSDASVYALALLVVLFAWSEVVLSEFYRRLSGVQLDDTGAFERGFRLIGGRRNTFFWSLIPFAAMDAWLAGLWFLAFYSIVTTFVAQWRFIVRVRDFTSGMSPIIARNFRDTQYFPDKKKSS